MRGKLLFLTLFAFACKEDQFPAGLYHYQAERLLSGGDSKTWVLVSSSESGTVTNPTLCSDTLRLLITEVASDSINISRLIPISNCTSFDSLKFGNANASGDLVFTDSIIFATGEVWIIDKITSKGLAIFNDDSVENYQSK